MRYVAAGMSWFIVIARLCLAPTADAAEGGLALVSDGKPMATIVIARQMPLDPEDVPKEANTYRRMERTIEWAAKDLQSYVRKISGAELPIAYDDEEVEGNLILVGESRQTRQMGLTSDSFEKQEYMIRADDERLVLIGHDQRFEDWAREAKRISVVWEFGIVGPVAVFQPIGSTYAVHDFLERFCGVRWYFPGEIGEVVPKQSTIMVPNVEIRRKPVTRHRMINRDLIPPKYYYEPFLAKVEWKDFWSNVHYQKDAFDWGTRLRVGGELVVANHSFGGYFGRFGETHPDWFADGKPAPGRMPCFTAPGLMEQVAQDARDFFDGKLGTQWAAGDFFAVVPMDSEGWCQCENCLKQYANRGTSVEGRWEGTLRTNYVWGFVSDVARELKKTHPGKVVTCVAYRGYMGAPGVQCNWEDRPGGTRALVSADDAGAGEPAQVQVPDNVAVQICSGFGAFSPGQRASYERIFADWASAVRPENVYVWWYWLWPTNPGYRSFPDVSPRTVGEMVRAMKRYGFTGGAMAQMDENHGVWWSYPVLDHLRVYVMAKLLDDWDRDEREIVEEYYMLFYGPARDPMRSFWEYIHDRGGRGKTPQFDWTELCPPEELTMLGEWLDKARALVPEDSAYRKRIDLIDEAAYRAYMVRASRETLGAQSDE